MSRFYDVMMPLNFPTEGTTEESIVEDEPIEEESVTEDEPTEEDKTEEEPELARVDYKELVKDFPELFKKHPDLKHAFFREQKYTEIFPTVEDAQRASEAQNSLEEITAAVVEGDAKKFISELESEDKDGLKNFASNFLPALRESNKELYFETVGPIVRQFVRNAYEWGNNRKDENVKNAAKVINQVLFGGDYEDIEKEGGLINKDKGKDDATEKEKQQWMVQKYNSLYSEVSTSCYSKLDEEINRGLEDLTKTKPGLKKLIAKDIRTRVLEEMDKDANHLQRMNGLWKREERNGFNGTYKNSILTTFIGKAKTLIPKIRIETRKEALGKEDTGTNDNKTRLSGGREHKGAAKKMTVERAREEKLTTKGIFDAD